MVRHLLSCCGGRTSDTVVTTPAGLYLPPTNRHAVAGITCDNQRYMYNGYVRKQARTLPLLKFDWVNEKDKCLVVNDPAKHAQAFEILSPHCSKATCLRNQQFSIMYNDKYDTDKYKREDRDYLFVNEKYTKRPLTRPNPLPRPSTRPPKPSPPPPPRPITRPPRPSPPPPHRPKKQCPPGKILNPKTNRCVKIDGKIGREILREHRLIP